MLSPSLPRRTLLGGAALLASPTLPGAEPAWPERPIRWIVNFPPAGAADILSRALGDWFGDRLGQPIVIENRQGPRRHAPGHAVERSLARDRPGPLCERAL